MQEEKLLRMLHIEDESVDWSPPAQSLLAASGSESAARKDDLLVGGQKESALA